MRMIFTRYVWLCALLLTSCNLIEYHPYDADITGVVGVNATNVARIEAECAAKDTVRFAVISDTQRWYDETQAAVRAINAHPDGIDFVIHCGDLTDFGLTKEFLWMRDILQNLRMPYVCLIGNHDCLGTGEQVFDRVFGVTNFSFTAGNVHFLCLNTNAFEYDYSVPIPDFGFLRDNRVALSNEVTRTVAVMHAKPFTEQFNNNVAYLFQEELRKYPSLTCCLCGHDHRFSEEDLFEDGVSYFECGAAKERAYLLFTFTPDAYTYEKIAY